MPVPPIEGQSQPAAAICLHVPGRTAGSLGGIVWLAVPLLPGFAEAIACLARSNGDKVG